MEGSPSPSSSRSRVTPRIVASRDFFSATLLFPFFTDRAFCRESFHPAPEVAIGSTARWEKLKNSNRGFWANAYGCPATFFDVLSPSSNALHPGPRKNCRPAFKTGEKTSPSAVTNEFRPKEMKAARCMARDLITSFRDAISRLVLVPFDLVREIRVII